MSSTKKKSAAKVKESPYTKLKQGKDEIKIRERLSPQLTTAASKYMKNANKLQYSGCNVKRPNNSQLQFLKSFLSGKKYISNKSKDSSLFNGDSIDKGNSSHHMTKSTERVYVDLTTSPNHSLN
jgi:hypothetical protein